MDDLLLLDGIRGRDPEAFRMLMERYASFIINLAYRFVGSLAEAEDVAQETFLRLYQHPPQLLPSVKLSTWLYRVTVNLSLDLLRKRPGKGTLVSLESPSSPEDEAGLSLRETLPDPSAASPRERLMQMDLADSLRVAVAALPETLRVPLLLSAFEELSHQEIAQILQVSQKAVERRIHRARELLKARLRSYL